MIKNILISGIFLNLSLFIPQIPPETPVIPPNTPVQASSTIPSAMAHEKEVVSVNKLEIPPVLQKVAFCESNQRQFYEDGKVITNINDNGTLDFGYFQINSIHLKETRRLGLDVIHSKEDNIEFGLLLYERHGLKPWYGYIPETGKCSWSDLEVEELMEIYAK